MGFRRGLRSTSIRPCSIWRGGSGVRARKGWPGGASRTTNQTAMVASAVKSDGGAEHGAPADGLRGPGQRRGGGQVAEQADGQDHGGEGGEAVRREPAGDHHHAADEHDAEAGAHQHAAGQQDRPGRRQGEDDAADGGEDEHADHGAAWAVTVEQEAAGDLHGGEAEEEGACKPTQGFRPDGQVAHQVQADGDVGGAEKMAGDVGSGQCRDDDQAPAVGERAPLGGLHRWGDVPLIVENCSAGVLNSRPYAALVCSSRPRPLPPCRQPGALRRGEVVE